MNLAVQTPNLHGADERTTSPALGTAEREQTAPSSAWSSALAIADDATVQAFAADGAVVLRGLLTPAEVAVLRAGIDTNLAAPSPRALVASRLTTPGSSSRTSATGPTTRSTGRSSSTLPWPPWRRG